MKRTRSAGASQSVAGAFRRGSSKANRPTKIPDYSHQSFRMFLVPCSCGTTFAVAENYDRQGTAWSRYMVCPGCGKHHDPKNRLLQMGFQSDGYWKVDQC
ncbi:MAG TPA: hypothetical protein VMB66_11760 [Candidatus Acidoferrales bacterium]|nr:hypothetical protein [Candidatus Acidoferrales bacterium]